jgi:hypothetical protein
MSAAVEADTLPEEPSADDLAELDTWNLEQTAREFLDASATLNLPELVEYQAQFYKSWPTAAGAMIATALESLAQKIRYVGAATPEDFEARADTIEHEAREQWQEIGYQEGLAAGRSECERRHKTHRTAFGHSSWED